MRGKIIFGIVLLGLILMPLTIGTPRWITIGCIVFYNIILASSWNFIMGYTGIFSFGHMASALIGAYTAALLIVNGGASPIIAMLVSGLTAAFANFLLGALCLRFRGFYLTLVTWAFAEMVITVINNEYKITGGSTGMFAKGIFPSSAYIPNYYLGLAIAVIFLVVLYILTHSKVCIYLKSIRDDEAASEVMGVDTTKWKIFSFTFSGFWAGTGGVYYLYFIGIIDPSAGNLMQLGNVMLMVIMGGIGTLLGPVIGAVIVIITSQLLVRFAAWSMMVFAILMIVILRYFRGGIIGGIDKIRLSINNSAKKRERRV
jgi:branched-chain amino acid transport system permease protein